MSLAPTCASGSPGSFRRNFFFLAPCAVGSLVFAAMVTVFFYLLIFTGSVGRRILIVVPVETLYRTSIIFSSIVLLLGPFAGLSLAPLFLFSICGPGLGVWPNCWVSAEFLHTPIPRKGSGSTTTTTKKKIITKRILKQEEKWRECLEYGNNNFVAFEFHFECGCKSLW